MSLRVGLNASKADLDVQGEIDFDFFEESDSSRSVNKTASLSQETSKSIKYSNNKSVDDIGSLLPNHGDYLKGYDLHKSNVPESGSSQYYNKPLITVSCDDATGLIQKTTIETVIPTPYNYKESKCGKTSPNAAKKGKRIPSPLLKSKLFKDENDVSDDSSLSSMSESESDISSGTEDSFELNEASDSMTDVSPLMSPYQCDSPMPGELKIDKGAESTRKEPIKGSVKFPDKLDKKECPKCDAIDINELLKAVKRLELGQNINNVCGKKCSTPPVITQNNRCRKNLSFSNEEVRRIDNDNQVLLKKIVAQQHRLKPRTNTSVRVLSSSAVNRQKQQRQIELENLALLKRLESTKASKNVSRNQLLQDYERRSSGVLSRASSRSSKSASQGTSHRSSNISSGRSSAISIKSNLSSALSAHSKQ